MTTLWTEEKIKRLIALRAEGHIAKDIAEKLGKEFTKNSVIGKLHRLGYLLSDVGHSHAQRIRDGVYRYRKTLGAKSKKPKKPKFPQHPLPVETDVPSINAVKFADLENHHCRYIFGEGLNALFCGEKKTLGSSYCAHHHLKCYRGAQ